MGIIGSISPKMSFFTPTIVNESLCFTPRGVKECIFYAFSGKVSHADLTSVLTHMNWTYGQTLPPLSPLDRHAILCHICGQNHPCILRNSSVSHMCEGEHAWTRGGGAFIVRVLCNTITSISINRGCDVPITTLEVVMGEWASPERALIEGEAPAPHSQAPKGILPPPEAAWVGGSPLNVFSYFFRLFTDNISHREVRVDHACKLWDFVYFFTPFGLLRSSSTLVGVFTPNMCHFSSFLKNYTTMGGGMVNNDTLSTFMVGDYFLACFWPFSTKLVIMVPPSCEMGVFCSKRARPGPFEGGKACFFTNYHTSSRTLKNAVKNMTDMPPWTIGGGHAGIGDFSEHMVEFLYFFGIFDSRRTSSSCVLAISPPSVSFFPISGKNMIKGGVFFTEVAKVHSFRLVTIFSS